MKEQSNYTFEEIEKMKREEYASQQLDEFCEKNKDILKKWNDQFWAEFLFGTEAAKELYPKLYE